MKSFAPGLIIVAIFSAVVLAVVGTFYLGNPLGQATRQAIWVASASHGVIRAVATEERDLQPMVEHAEKFTTALESWLQLPRPVTTIAMFSNRRDYTDFAQSRIPGFHRRMDFCYSPALRMILGYRVNNDGERTRLQHELFHHLSFSRKERMPLWLEEGVAELVEGMVLDDAGTLTLTKVQANHYRTAGRFVLRGGIKGLHKVLNGGRNTLASNPQVFYSVGYMMALYLMYTGQLQSAIQGSGWTYDPAQIESIIDFFKSPKGMKSLIGIQIQP
jgi:hypothetical protein